jgi:ankyrin repeat protein
MTKEGLNPAHFACKSGKVKGVTTISIIYGKEIFLKPSKGVTYPIVYALEKPDTAKAVIDMVVKLVGKRVLELKDEEGSMLAHYATRHNNFDVVEYLRGQLGTRIFHVQNKKGSSAVHLGADSHGLESIEKLWKLIGNEVFTEPCYGNNPLLFLAQGSTEIFEIAVKKTGDSKILRIVNSQGHNLAHLAASNGDVETCKLLAKYNLMDLFSQGDIEGNLPYFFAKAKKHQPVLEFMREAGIEETNKINKKKAELQSKLQHKKAREAEEKLVSSQAEAKVSRARVKFRDLYVCMFFACVCIYVHMYIYVQIQ